MSLWFKRYFNILSCVVVAKPNFKIRVVSRAQADEYLYSVPTDVLSLHEDHFDSTPFSLSPK